MARSRLGERQVRDSDFLSEAEFAVSSGTLQADIDSKSDSGHLHDDRYYTEVEVDTISGSLQLDIDNKITDTEAIKWAIVFGGM